MFLFIRYNAEDFANVTSNISGLPPLHRMGKYYFVLSCEEEKIFFTKCIEQKSK